MSDGPGTPEETPPTPPKKPRRKPKPPVPPPTKRWRDRPTGDLLVLGVAATICFTVLTALVVVAIIEIAHPEADTDAVTSNISDVINTLIGLLAGFLAGRTDFEQQQLRKQERDHDEFAG